MRTALRYVVHGLALTFFFGCGEAPIEETRAKTPTDADVFIHVATSGATLDSIVRVNRYGNTQREFIPSIFRDTILTLNVVDSGGQIVAHKFYASGAGLIPDVMILFVEPDNASTVSVALAPIPPEEPPPTGTLAVWSGPEGANFTLTDLVTNAAVASGTTDTVLELPPGCYLAKVTLRGYSDLTDAECVSTGLKSDVGGVLSKIEEPPPPPDAKINVDRMSINFGDTITICIESKNATVGLLTPLNIFALNGCFKDAPFATTEYFYFVVGAGGIAESSVRVTVSPPQPNLTLDSVMFFFPDPSISDRNTSTSLGSYLLPQHVGPVQVSVWTKYSGNGHGHRDEAFALTVGGAEVRSPGSNCAVVPDNPNFTGLIWVTAGFIDFPGGTENELEAIHAADQRFRSCYTPVDGFEGKNALSFRAAKFRFFR